MWLGFDPFRPVHNHNPLRRGRIGGQSDAEVEAHVLRNPLDPQGLTHALDHSVVLDFTARERHHGLCRSPSLQQVAPVHDQASVDGPPRARAPSVVSVDVHLEVGLDILPCEPQHLS